MDVMSLAYDLFVPDRTRALSERRLPGAACYRAAAGACMQGMQGRMQAVVPPEPHPNPQLSPGRCKQPLVLAAWTVQELVGPLKFEQQVSTK